MNRCLTVLAVSCLIFSGCKTKNKWEDVPLTEGDVPYVLPPGEYIDITGKTHIETKNRWSLSEGDVYNYIKYLKEKDDNKNRNNKY